jgi:acetyltransferase-like isoleucine patch superfamily enzyme
MWITTMILTSKIRRFLQLPPYGKLVQISNMLARAKTAMFYKWAFGHMGRGCILGKPLLLNNPQYIYLGDHVSIKAGARLETIRPFPQRTPELRIGNDASIEQNAHIVCQSRIIIGNNASISANCCLLDTSHPFHDPLNQPSIVSRLRDEDSFIEIGDGTLIGYGCVILPNVRIGKYAVIGALSVVDKDVPDFGIVRGNPAHLLQIYHVEPSE